MKQKFIDEAINYAVPMVVIAASTIFSLYIYRDEFHILPFQSSSIYIMQFISPFCRAIRMESPSSIHSNSTNIIILWNNNAN